MTATLDAAAGRARAARRGQPAWRTRILPPTDGRGGWLATLARRPASPGCCASCGSTCRAGRIFDEVYYACDAQNLLRFGVEHDTVERPDDARSRALRADRAQPARSSSTRRSASGRSRWGCGCSASTSSAGASPPPSPGTLMVVVLVRVARRMTGSTVLGCLAGLLLALDGLHFVQSRVAMLDIFLAVLGAVRLRLPGRRPRRRAAAARACRRRRAAPAGGPRLGLRPWRLAAGVCLGAAVATKWSGLYFVAVLVLLAFAWEVGARRTAGVRAPVRATLRALGRAPLAALVLLPAVLYVAVVGRLVRQRQRLRPQLGGRATRRAALAGSCPDGAALAGGSTTARSSASTTTCGRRTPTSRTPPAGCCWPGRCRYYYPAGVGPRRLRLRGRAVLARGARDRHPGALVGRDRRRCSSLLWLWAGAAATGGPAAVLVMVAHRRSCRGSATTSTAARCSCSTRCRPCRSCASALALVAGWALGGAGASRRGAGAGGRRRPAPTSPLVVAELRLPLPGARRADDAVRRLARPHVVPQLDLSLPDARTPRSTVTTGARRRRRRRCGWWS